MPPSPKTTPEGIEESNRFTPRYNKDGLVPAIAVDATDADVLMMAWMNDEALRLTLATGYAHYFSRSRNCVWKKGETSGALQRVVEVLTDCDQDVLLLRAEVSDRTNTCHTGRPTCFYRAVPLGKGSVERQLTPRQTAGS